VGELPNEVFRVSGQGGEPGNTVRGDSDHGNRNSVALAECKSSR
jgi:hypothetical protein